MQEKSSRNATYLAFIETRLEGYRPVPYICRKRFRDNSRSNGFPIGPKSHSLPHFGPRIWWSFSHVSSNGHEPLTAGVLWHY